MACNHGHSTENIGLIQPGSPKCAVCARWYVPELERVLVRFDGIYPDITGDNLGFTVMSHFIGADGRDYYQSSWIGIESLMKIGLDLTKVSVIEKGGNK